MGAAHGCFIYLTKLHLKVSQSLLTQEVLRCEWYRCRYWMGRQPYRGEGSGERGELGCTRWCVGQFCIFFLNDN